MSERIQEPVPLVAGHLRDEAVDAAINWAVKLHHGDPTPEMRRSFERWLMADPLHAEAWQRVCATREALGRVPAALARSTLQRVDTERRRRGLNRRAATRVLTAAGLAWGVAWIARETTPWQRLLADASTAVGEQKTLRLADGTVVALNTDSAISSELGAERRLVVLRRGEIQVSSGANAQSPVKRPLWVQTPHGSMQALGTRFTVRLLAGRARVSVQEGAVELHTADGTATANVRPGETRWLGDHATEPAPTQGIEPDGWTDGVIAGQNILLSDLLTELARYRVGRVVCDPRVAGLKVSGLYHIKDTDQALQFLVQTQPLRVVYRTRYWVSVEPALGQ